MTTRTRLIVLGGVCICVVLVSFWRQSQEQHISPDMFEQIHDSMREADVVALLGIPWPAKYDADGSPVPVALIAGPWEIVRVIPSKAAGAHDSGIAKRLEFVSDEWGISVSFNVAGQLSWRALLRRANSLDP